MKRIKHNLWYWTEVYGLRWYNRRVFLGYQEYNSFIEPPYTRNAFIDVYSPNNLKK